MYLSSSRDGSLARDTRPPSTTMVELELRHDAKQHELHRRLSERDRHTANLERQLAAEKRTVRQMKAQAAEADTARRHLLAQVSETRSAMLQQMSGNNPQLSSVTAREAALERDKAVRAAERARAECEELRAAAAAACREAAQREQRTAMDAAAQRREHENDIANLRKQLEDVLREKAASDARLLAVQTQLQHAQGQKVAEPQGHKVAAAGGRMFARGESVVYRTRTGGEVVAEVIGVHHDTCASAPYYTIICTPSGSERQTEGSRLRPLMGMSSPMPHASTAGDGTHASSSALHSPALAATRAAARAAAYADALSATPVKLLPSWDRAGDTRHPISVTPSTLASSPPSPSPPPTTTMDHLQGILPSGKAAYIHAGMLPATPLVPPTPSQEAAFSAPSACSLPTDHRPSGLEYAHEHAYELR